MDEEQILKTAQLHIRHGLQSKDIAERAECEDTEEGAKFLWAVADRMNWLIAEGHEPKPLPE